MDFIALQDTLAPSRSTESSLGIESQYTLLSELGSGAYGVVWKARKNKTNEIFAVKKVSKRRAGAKGLREVMGEVETMSLLNHPNIVRLEETCQDDRFLWIVMEYEAGGELQGLLDAQLSLPESLTRRVVIQLVMALEYIHDRGVVHRDLKPSNCLLSKNDFVVKISDFGFAVLAGADQCLTTYCGTMSFMAPEILQNMNYGRPVDMWALGVMTYLMFVGEYPFTGDSTSAIRRSICRRGFVPNNSRLKEYPLLQDFILKLLTADPKQRLTAKEALRHPWIRATIDTTFKNSEESARAVKKERSPVSQLKSAVIAIIATHHLRYLQRCRELAKCGYGQFALLRDYHYVITGMYSPPGKILDCSHMFSACPMALMEVFSMVQSCTYLTELNVSHNSIDSLTIVQGLLKVVGTHPSLTKLNISHNPISILAGRGLLRLSRNPVSRVRHIDVSDTLLPPDFVAQIAANLKEKTSPHASSTPLIDMHGFAIHGPGRSSQRGTPHMGKMLSSTAKPNITFGKRPHQIQHGRRLPPLSSTN